MILTLRTDSPVAEIGLYTPDGHKKAYLTWQADRTLARDLLTKIADQLAKCGVDFTALTGIVVFGGPGSFTGLRIGLTTANTIAYGRQIPIVSAQGEDWIAAGLGKLAGGKNDKIALPAYGAEANITLPKRSNLTQAKK